MIRVGSMALKRNIERYKSSSQSSEESPSKTNKPKPTVNKKQQKKLVTEVRIGGGGESISPVIKPSIPIPPPPASPLVLVSKTAKPSSTMLNANLQARMEAWIQDNVSQTKLPCAEVLVYHRNKLVCDFAHRGIHTSAAASEESTIYRMYSMTKPVVTVLLFTLFEEGKFQLDQPVHKFLGPKWKKENMKVIDLEQTARTGHVVETPCLKDITIHHLLTHTSGLSHGLSNNAVDLVYQTKGLGASNTILLSADTVGLASLSEFVDKLSECPLLFQPGTQWHYSYGIEVLGRLIEVLNRGAKTLETYCQERLCKKLGMTDTTFSLTPQQEARLCPFYFRNQQGKLCTQDTHYPTRYCSGSVGLYSTREDYFKFASMLANGGMGLNKERILSPKTVEWMMINHLHDDDDEKYTATTIQEMKASLLTSNATPVPSGFGMGYGGSIVVQEQEDIKARLGEFGWAGTTSTCFWVDVSNQVVCVFMSSMLLSEAEEWSISKILHSLVYSSLDPLL